MANFKLWSTLGPFFTTATGPIDAYWARGNAAGGDEPVWMDTESATPYQPGTVATYEIEITAQDFLGEQQAAVTVATVTMAAPFANFAAAVNFQTNNYVESGAFLYWRASATAGAFDLVFQSYTDYILNIPTTVPAISPSAGPLVLETGVANLTGYSFNSNATTLVYSYSTASSATTENIYIQSFNSSGGANSPLVQVASGVDDSATLWYIGSNSSGFTYVHTNVSGSLTGVYVDSIDTSSGAIGTSLSYFIAQTSYSQYFGVGDRSLSNGTRLLFTQGISNGADVLDVSLIGSSNQSLGLATEYHVTGTSAVRWSEVGVYDPATGKNDDTVLAFDSGDEVHLELLGIDGKQIGSDFVVPGLTSFTRLRAMGSRVEIEYYQTTASGTGNFLGYIYDTSTAPYTVTLGTFSQHYVGTPFNDSFTDGSGTHAINGGGGRDTLTVNSSLSQIKLAVDAAGHVNLRTPISTDRLERFTTVTFSDATLTIADGPTTTGNARPGTPAAFTVAHAGTTLTVSETLTYASAFTMAAQTVLALTGGALTLKNAVLAGVVNGMQNLNAAGYVSLTGTRIGGTVALINTGTVTASGGTIVLGDALGNAAVLDNAKGATFAIADNSGIVRGTSTSCNITNFGLFEKKGGAGASVINAVFNDTGTVSVAVGTLTFAGASNTFTGAITGNGTLLLANGSKSTINSGSPIGVAALGITGGNTALTLAENLSYAGTFTQGPGTTLALTAAGGHLLLTGQAHLSGLETGTNGNKVFVEGPTTTVSGLTIGGTLDWIDTKSVTQAGGNVVVGDSSTNAAILSNYAGATYAITDNSSIARGAASGSFILDQGTIQKTGGTGTSTIAPNIVNNASAAGAIGVTSGTLDLGGTLSGALALKVGAGAVLILEKSAAAGSAASYAGAGATLQLNDAQEYHGTIAGFAGGEGLDLRSIRFGSGVTTTLAYSGNTTTGTLTVSDGSRTASLAMLGSYTTQNFALATDGRGGTAVTFASSGH